MAERIRGLFDLDPPAHGLDRLRRAMQQDDSSAPWLSLMPWAATAMLLLVSTAPMLAGRVRELRLGVETTERIVAGVRDLEPEPWEALPGGGAGARFYLARPEPASGAPAQLPAMPPR